MTAIEVTPKEMKAFAEKKARKEKRKRDQEETKTDDDDGDDDGTTPSQDEDSRNKKRSKKRKEKEALMALVPETNEHGIAYTKLQRRRMMKRVKRGLPPVPTPEEELERLKQEAELKREEEEELAGMLYQRDDKHEIDHLNDQKIDEDLNDLDDERFPIDESEDNPGDDVEQKPMNESSSQDQKSKKRRAKQVPTDYVCQACKNSHATPHWIYDCPDKVTIRGTNQVSKSVRGIHNPDDKKVFVSGLPFEMKRKDVETLFASCGKLVHCKLLTFPDTGRCKGQAFLTFDTAESASKAILLNNTTIDATPTTGTNREGQSGKSRSTLKLKVSKMLNRAATKEHKTQK